MGFSDVAKTIFPQEKSRSPKYSDNHHKYVLIYGRSMNILQWRETAIHQKLGCTQGEISYSISSRKGEDVFLFLIKLVQIMWVRVEREMLAFPMCI